MRKLPTPWGRGPLALIILGCLLAVGQPLRSSAATPSDWPSLNYDAAQSNYNRVEKTLSAQNVLKLKVQWTAPIPDVSYPIVAGGRVYLPTEARGLIHLHACDAITGKYLAKYSKDAYGGVLASNGNLYVAGKYLQELDPATGKLLARIKTSPSTATTSFVDPLADTNVLLAGYVDGVNSRIYTVDPTANQILRQMPSVSARGAVTTGRVVTGITTGSALYDESTGRALAHRPYFGSFWFAGSDVMYTVAAAATKKRTTTMFAIDGTGRQVWSRPLGPALATSSSDWPHAVSPTSLYVQTYTPQEGILALDPLAGAVQWRDTIPYVQRIALANNVLLVLTYALGQPVKLIALHADTGKSIGAIVLSGIYTFNAQNELMIADGMIFVRATSIKGSLLLALGLQRPTTNHCGF